MTELDPIAHSMLDALRAPMPQGERKAVWNELQRSLADGAPPVFGSGSPPVAYRYRWWMVGAVSTVAAAALVVLAVGAPRFQAEDAERSTSAAYVSGSASVDGSTIRKPVARAVFPPEQAPALDRGGALGSTAVGGQLAAIGEASDEPHSRRRHAQRRRPRLGDPRDEMALLVDARAAIKRREFASALSALRRHKREFPRTTFGDERVVLSMRALCGAQRLDDARTLLARRSTDRALAARLKQACPALEG